jgi:hypothetical protein
MSADGVVIPEEEPQPSKKAQKEAARIAEGNLRRDEAIRTHIHLAGLVVLWVLVAVLLILSLIWAWHMATPLYNTAFIANPTPSVLLQHTSCPPISLSHTPLTHNHRHCISSAYIS